ncbi:SDR family oxidoreductase [Salirhabdus salicampi]|uniref:SDR family oxidoreductase n=1 Tax=Salirhabdus salicampi TaxID=476102 RepID=UPI0020C34078|nr:SDR family oxidoreductase [Salirhabdus salicampi]MCP8617572.1 SDR family oxidoreductase [Salirhabdus salicampi]
MSLQNQIAIVTGAGKGVGKEVAKELLSSGVHVFAVTRSEEDLDRLHEETSEIRQENGTNLYRIAGDVSKEETLHKTMDAVKEKHGRVDMLINNAGIGRYGKLDDLDIGDYDAMMDSNMRSTFLFSKGVLPFMKEQKYGHILNVASVAGKKGLPNETVYCASKFAQVGFAQALDHEVREFGIKVSSLCPGGINTNFAMGTGRTPDDPNLEQFLDAKDVLEAVMFILKQSPKSRVIELFMRPVSEPI